MCAESDSASGLRFISGADKLNGGLCIRVRYVAEGHEARDTGVVFPPKTLDGLLHWFSHGFGKGEGVAEAARDIDGGNLRGDVARRGIPVDQGGAAELRDVTCD